MFEEWKKIYCTNINQRKAGMDMLISDKVDFRAKKFTRVEGIHYIVIKESVHQDTVMLYIFAYTTELQNI